MRERQGLYLLWAQELHSIFVEVEHAHGLKQALVVKEPLLALKELLFHLNKRH